MLVRSGVAELASALHGIGAVGVDAEIPPVGTEVGVERTRIEFGSRHAGPLKKATRGFDVVLTAARPPTSRVVRVNGWLTVPEAPLCTFFTLAIIVKVPSNALGVQAQLDEWAKPRRRFAGLPGGAIEKLYS